MNKKEQEAMLTLANYLLKDSKPRTRVLMCAQLLTSILKQLEIGPEETAAALKTMLVVRGRDFTVAQKAVVESVMSRDLLPLGIDEALNQSKL